MASIDKRLHQNNMDKVVRPVNKGMYALKVCSQVAEPHDRDSVAKIVRGKLQGSTE